jgi:two-component system cell cycle response regulator DivK
VVEDHPINLELMAALLAELDCEVGTAATAEQGLQLAASERPQVILVDVQLPDMDGYQLTRCLKADPATADIPVVAVTAHALTGEESRARAAGCAAYLAKPVSRDSLLATLRGFLAAARD